MMKKGRFSEEQVVKTLQEADRTPDAAVAKAQGGSAPRTSRNE
ncbi:MAG: hypothetical protein ABW206_04975 [Agrobacterium vaccinii]